MDTSLIKLRYYAAYDKDGYVYSIIPPSVDHTSLIQIKDLDKKALSEFINELVFLRYSFKGSWRHILHENGFISDNDQSRNLLNGQQYSDTAAKDYIVQLITNGELAVYYTGEWIPHADRNHHQPPRRNVEEQIAAPMPVHSLGPETTPEETNWIDLEYLYADGTGVAGAEYEVRSLSGSLLSTGSLNQQGQSRVTLPLHESQVTVKFFNDPQDVAILKPSNPVHVNVSDQGWFESMSSEIIALWDSTTETVYDASVWTWGMVQGDFNKNPTTGQLITNCVITAIPLIDQVGDVRDLTANLKLLVWDKQYKDGAVWFALFVTLIGLIPTLGSLLKGVIKLIWKGAKLDDLLKLFNYFMKGNGIKWLKELKAGKLDDYKRQAAQMAHQLFNVIIQKLNKLKNSIPSSVTSLQKKISDLIDTLNHVKNMINDQFDKISKQIIDKLDELLARNSDSARSASSRQTHQHSQQALDANELASLNVHRVTAPIDFDGHIINAEIKPNGKVVGGHSTAGGNVRVIPGTESPPNQHGVYEAKIEVEDPDNPGQYLQKTNNGGKSTMFPDDWTADRIKVEVDHAYQNRNVTGQKWTGTTPSGVRVEGWLHPNTTVYPKI